MTTVVPAWVHPTEVDASFMHSMLSVVGRDLTGPRRITQWMPVRCGSGGLIAARNEIASAFLEHTDAEWLWWIDTDMGFEPTALDQLLEHADPTDRPILGGLCFAQIEREPDGMGGYRSEIVPALYQWWEGSDASGFVAWRDYPQDTLVEVAATGSAFVLIHRTVLERVAEHFGHGNWYTRMMNPGSNQLLGEDLSFCARARMIGIPTHVHTGIRTTHRKPRWISDVDYDHPTVTKGTTDAD